MTNQFSVDPLFNALAEQLKVPLLQIARLSDLQNLSALPRISVISENALKLVDAYMQYSFNNKIKIQLEPINTSSIIYDVAHDLLPYAKQSDYKLEIDVSGKISPIMGNRDSLRVMLTLLGTSLIESANDELKGERKIVLGTHRTAKGAIVGLFSNNLPLTQNAIRLTRELHHLASQPVPSLGMAGGAGLAIADKLSEQMDAPLKSYRHRSMNGIGSLLGVSRQLQLV